MAQSMSTNQFLLSRGMPDRRNAMFGKPPFMTEDGMVLIDRRDQVERRGRGGERASGSSTWFSAANQDEAEMMVK
jgi:hypothetical protein